MTEIRLTFASEGLHAVSKVLVDMGIGFQVEPVGAASKAPSAPSAPAVPQPTRRASSRGTRKNAAKVKRATVPERQPASSPLAGAERLRAAITSSGGPYRSAGEPAAEAAQPGGGAPAGKPQQPGDE